MGYALLDGGRVTKKNADAFFQVLEAGMANPHRLRDKTYRIAYRKLYSAAISRASLFPSSAALALRVWELQVLAQVDLYTDDTFQFNRAAKAVREALIGLPCIYPALEPQGATHHPEEERPNWSQALFDCLGAAMEHHKFTWARPTCDMLIKAAIERRQNFAESQQDELQRWNAKCKGLKIARQQEHASTRQRELSTFERQEAQWSAADIKKTKESGGDHGGGGLDGWCAKQ